MIPLTPHNPTVVSELRFDESFDRLFDSNDFLAKDIHQAAGPVNVVAVNSGTSG